MTIKKFLALAMTILALIFCAWLSASIYIGRSTSQKITQFAMKFTTTFKNPFDANSKVRIVEHKHEQGLFSSKGQFEIRFINTQYAVKGLMMEQSDRELDEDAPTESGADTEIPTVLLTDTATEVIQVVYQASNLLYPNSSMRIDWNAKLAGERGEEWKQQIGQEMALSGEAHKDYRGKFISTLKLPGFVDTSGDEKLIVTPSVGLVSWKDDAMTFDLKTDRISFAIDGRTQDKKIEGIHISSDMQNVRRGLGAFQISVANWMIPEKSVAVKGYNFKYIGIERDGRLHFSADQTIDEFVTKSTTLEKIVLNLSLNDLDCEGIEKVWAEIFSSPSPQEPEVSKVARLGIAIRKIIDKGFKFSVPKLSAEFKHSTGIKKGQGLELESASIRGGMIFEVLKAQENATNFDIEKSVRSSGEILVNNLTLLEENFNELNRLGIVVPTIDGMKGSYVFNGKTVNKNGEVIDHSALIERLNREINSMFYEDLSKGG